MKQEITFEFQKALLPMVAEQFITADGATVVVDKFIELLDKYSDEVAERLRSLATDWEAKMGENDKTLYSLGVRHAVDLVTEFDPTTAPTATDEVDA